VVIVIPEDYSETFGEARRATVQVLLDSSRRAARTSIQRTLNLLTRYDAQIAALRLMAHGVSPEVMRPLDVESVDLASRKKRAARRVLDVLPMFFILAAFIAGVNVAIDTTAGERERQSLEPLLTNPVSRYALVLGKWMTTLTFCAIGVILTVTFTLLALRQTSFEGLGVQIHLGSDEIAGLLAAALPMAPLAASVQMFFATFARSFKEAQTYVTLLPLAAMVPTVMLQLAPIKTAAWMMLVPALGQQQLLMDTLAGENHGALFVVAAVAAVIYALLGVIATAYLLSRERIVLGR
jgi:sodium transport system permease protein